MTAVHNNFIVDRGLASFNEASEALRQPQGERYVWQVPICRAELVEAGESYALPVYLAMIASCTGFGQAWYSLNSMLKVARPCVLDRTTVA